MKWFQYQKAFWKRSPSSDFVLIVLLVMLLSYCERLALLLSLTQKKSNTTWHMVIKIAALRITQLNRSRYHQYNRIKLLEINTNETYGLNPYAVPLVVIVHVYIM